MAQNKKTKKKQLPDGVEPDGSKVKTYFMTKMEQTMMSDFHLGQIIFNAAVQGMEMAKESLTYQMKERVGIKEAPAGFKRKVEYSAKLGELYVTDTPLSPDEKKALQEEEKKEEKN